MREQTVERVGWKFGNEGEGEVWKKKGAEQKRTACKCDFQLICLSVSCQMSISLVATIELHTFDLFSA